MITLPKMGLQSFRAMAKQVGADLASKTSWETGDQLKAEKAPLFKAPPTPSKLNEAGGERTPGEWHSLVCEAAGRSLGGSAI